MTLAKTATEMQGISPPEPPPLVRMHSISKRFGEVVAIQDADFELLLGEVHGLLGENGAGKTSLMNVLFGLYHPDAGEIDVDGKLVAFRTPSDAIRMGIGMVHQSFRNIPILSVAENVILGLRSEGTFLDLEKPSQRIAELSERYHLGINPKSKLSDLSAGEQQRVEILKALYRNIRVLILDEPTSVLTPSEIEGLFISIEKMVAEGHGVVFISHKLGEVKRICDRITVMRDGQTIRTVEKQQVSEVELARLMVGRDVVFRFDKIIHEPGNVILRTIGIKAKNDAGLEALSDVSLDLHCGQILGIAGVGGNGQSELAEVLAGLRKLTAGELIYKGEKINNLSPQDIINRGIALIPEKPREMGVLPGFTIEENTALKVFGRSPFHKGWFLNYDAIGHRADELMHAFDIRAPNRMTRAGTLSGGNINKLILAGELSRNPDLIIAVNPTAGLDVGATEYIRKHLLDERLRDKAILLISSDLEEVLGLSDQVAVIYRGKLSPSMDTGQVTRDEIGLLMAGGQASSQLMEKSVSSPMRVKSAPKSGSIDLKNEYVAQKTSLRLGQLLNIQNLYNRLADRSIWESIFGVIISISLALVIVGILMAIMRINPFQAYAALWNSAFGTLNGFAETLVRTTPVLFTGLAMVVAYRCGIWSIGGEGQLYFGAIGATIVGILSIGLPSWIHIPLVILSAFLFGALYGAIPGLMLVYRNANELITTMMMNYLAVYFTVFLISGNGPLRDTQRIVYQAQSLPIASSARLPIIIAGTRAHAGILIGLVTAVVVYIFLWKTTLGFRIRAVGDNPTAARFAGIKVSRSIILALAISGGLAGMAGMVEVTAVQGHLVELLSISYGYTGIAVALLGGLHPAGALLTALFFGGLAAGAAGLQRAVGVPTATTQIIQGLILMFVLARGVFKFSQKRVKE
jgi:ABC-type uncharacterized transport system ATPase subunit/ABC-type uncharacterized transport system permease subunit